MKTHVLLNLKESLLFYARSFLNAYSQIFFSQNIFLSIVLLSVSFFDVQTGLTGAFSIIITIFIASILKLSRDEIRSGNLLFNPLLVGLAAGHLYTVNTPLILLLAVISVFVFLITAWFKSGLGARGLSYLSLPFLIGVWALMLGAGQFSALDLRHKESIELIEFFKNLSEYTTSTIETLPFANVIHLYLRSLGAIIFVYNDLAGFIIAIAILVASRIHFTLSIWGFLIGYIFYMQMEGDFTQLIYSYVGFNFILSGMALGGFYVIPSAKSYLFLLITIPVIAIMIAALHPIFQVWSLPLFSLPFVLLTLLLTFVYKHYANSRLPVVSSHLNRSPEQNLYEWHHQRLRYQNHTYFNFSLPVEGIWRISQGYNGAITHREYWQHALDFDKTDSKGKTWSGTGKHPEDFYCYHQPVLAPCDGVIAVVEDFIADNEIGNVDLEKNWGNTIIIKHADYLYSKLCHLKPGSIIVSVGDYVQRGQIIALCGNSGRSPEPHLHFQIQSYPVIGAATIPYPMGYFLSYQQNDCNVNELQSTDNLIPTWHQFAVPSENERVSNVKPDEVLLHQFLLFPGGKFEVKGIINGRSFTDLWTIHTDIYNVSYFYSENTKATATFTNDKFVFLFNHYKGSKNNPLFHFYTALYKIPMAYYNNMSTHDVFPAHIYTRRLIYKWLDFISPFYRPIDSKYSITFNPTAISLSPSDFIAESELTLSVLNKKVKNVKFAITITKNEISINNNASKNTFSIICSRVN